MEIILKKNISYKTVVITIAVIFLIPLLLGFKSAEKSKYPKPTTEFFVNDFADIIDEKSEREISNNSVALFDKTTAQVVVVTVENLGGEEPADYALNLGREWGVGNDKKNNGVVILLSRDDRQIYISVGYGLEGALPDSKTGRIIDLYGLEYLQADDFSNGLLAIQKAVISVVYNEYGIENSEELSEIYNNIGESEETSVISIIYSWGILIFIVFIYILIFGRRGIHSFGFGIGGMSFNIGHHNNNRFGGGSFGGGGGFSGGGGSFGGGGAGRGF